MDGTNQSDGGITMTDLDHDKPHVNEIDELFKRDEATEPIPTLSAATEYDPVVSKRRLRPRTIVIGSISVVAAGGLLTTGMFLGRLGNESHTDKGAPNPNANKRPAAAAVPLPTATPEASVTPQSTPSVEASAAPTPTPETTTRATGYEIPSGLSAEQFGEQFVNRISTWLMMGTETGPNNDPNSDLFNAWLNKDAAGDAQLIQDTATANAERITNALFIPNWETSETLTVFKDKEMQANSANIDSWLHTYQSLHPEDLAPWTDSVTLDSATAKPGGVEGGRMITIVGTEHNNADQNRIGSVYNPAEKQINGSHFTFLITTKIVDGTERIASWANESAEQ